MKYKTTGTRAGHKIMIRTRETSFDKTTTPNGGSFGKLEDHKEMKTYEYAAFQKKIFAEKARLKRRRIKLFAITAVIVILVLLMIPYIIKLIFDPSFQSMKFNN